jgi:ribonucleoside-diphosphate reductase alpha chain
MSLRTDLDKLKRYSVGVGGEGGGEGYMFDTDQGDWLKREDVVNLLNSTQPEPFRERLSDTRQSITRKFEIARPGHRNGDLSMYVTVGLYPDGRPGEIFIHSDRTGSFASGALDAVAMCMSIALQHGVPFEPLVGKLKGMRFEPQGMTGDPKYAIVTSPLDYVARWLLDRFGKPSTEYPGNGGTKT